MDKETKELLEQINENLQKINKRQEEKECVPVEKPLYEKIFDFFGDLVDTIGCLIVTSILLLIVIVVFASMCSRTDKTSETRTETNQIENNADIPQDDTTKKKSILTKDEDGWKIIERNTNE